VSAGKEAGGYDDVFEAPGHGENKGRGLCSDPGTCRDYDKLFQEYQRLHDYSAAAPTM
jgi:hypothetical protein